MRTFAEQYRRWYTYEKEIHQKVLASLETIPESGRSSGAYLKIVELLAHLVAARRMWLHRLEPTNPRPADLFPKNAGLADVVSDLESIQHKWTSFYDRLTDADLERVLEYKTTDRGWFRTSLADVLTQLYGHSLYHRGQIATLVRSCGGVPAETDFIYWCRESIPEPPA
jgi:uncharacterized damage-inducible protein DinB